MYNRRTYMTTPYHYLQVLYFRGAKVRKLIGSHKVITIYFKAFPLSQPFHPHRTLKRSHSFCTILLAHPTPYALLPFTECTGTTPFRACLRKGRGRTDRQHIRSPCLLQLANIENIFESYNVINIYFTIFLPFRI